VCINERGPVATATMLIRHYNYYCQLPFGGSKLWSTTCSVSFTGLMLFPSSNNQHESTEDCNTFS